jgi:branched-chain amino acid transport system ATP-binding protein
MASIDLNSVKAGYAKEDEVLRGLSLSIDAGSLSVIIGPNGAGKSTALKVIAGQLPIREGSVSVGGELVSTAAGARLHPGIAYVPQERNVFPSMTVRENLEMGAFTIRKGLRERIDRVLDRLPVLAGRLGAPAKTLSGGQRQMLALGIALMAEPSALLLDEPSAGLSPQAVAEMFRIVRSLHADGITIVMVEQNALSALAVATHGIVLVLGKVRLKAAAEAVANHPDVRKLFLGGK